MSMVIDIQRPPAISEMQAWQFWARELIDATPEERELMKQGKLSADRVAVLAQAGARASETLAMMPVPGYQEWMTAKRGMN